MNFKKVIEEILIENNNNLEEIIIKIRRFLEERWNDNNPVRQCIRTVYFLQKVLGGKIKGGWVTTNPKSHEKGGFKDSKGNWNFHYWLEKDGKIIDLTSDQFGEPKINILPNSDNRYYHNADAYNLKHDFRYTPIIVDKWIKDFKEQENKF